MLGLSRTTVAPATKAKAADQSQAVIAFQADGTVLEANENFLRLMGYSSDEIRGRHHRLFVEPSEAESPAYEAFWTQLRSGQGQMAEYRRLGKGGRVVWIRATYTPVRNRAGRVVQIVKFAMDVTAEKLAAAEAAGQIAAINKSQAVIQFALDGTITGANEKFLAAVGYRSDEVIGQHHRLFVDRPHAASREYAAFWEALRRGEYQEGEYKRFGKDGREIWLRATYNPIFDLSGRPFKVVKYATDVTAEKLHAADSSGQIEAIGRSQAVIHFDMDGIIQDANANFLTVMGYTMDELRGQHHRMFVTPNHAAGAAYRTFWDNLRAGQFASAVYQRLGKGGREVWIQATYNPVLDMNGRPFKVVKYAIDITKNMQVRSEAVRTAERTLDNISAVAVAAEQMHATSEAVAEQMSRSRSTVEEIHHRAKAVEGSTDQLRRAAQAMDGVVQTITKITEQINLLALNATIEAARAGAAGRGFAVVATEVKNLADQAKQATSSVSGEIASMQSVSAEVSNALSSIAASVDALQGFVVQTSEATKQQRVSTGEVTANIRITSKGVEGIARSLDEWVVGLEERRTDLRSRVLESGTVTEVPDVGSGASKGEASAGGASCFIIDSSQGGAKLRVRSADVPDSFVLTPRDGKPRRCSVVRRNGDEVSVRYVA